MINKGIGHARYGSEWFLNIHTFGYINLKKNDEYLYKVSRNAMNIMDVLEDRYFFFLYSVIWGRKEYKVTSKKLSEKLFSVSEVGIYEL